MKRLLLALFLLLLAIQPLRAEWSVEATHALAYLTDEPRLNADLDALSEDFQILYLEKLDDLYARELIRRQVITQQDYISGLWSFDYLTTNDRNIFADVRRDFQRDIEMDLTNLKSRVAERERAMFRRYLSSTEMVTLKDSLFEQPKFFDYLFTYNNYQRFAEDVEVAQHSDGLSRAEIAQSLAEDYISGGVEYDFASDRLPVISPVMLRQNLNAILSNDLQPDALAQIRDMAESETGKHYLDMQDENFKNRFLSVQTMYQKRLALTAAVLKKRLTTNPPMLIGPLHPGVPAYPYPLPHSHFKHSAPAPSNLTITIKP